MDVTKDAALTHQTLAVQTYRETQQDVQTAADADVIRVMAVQTAVTVTAAAETADVTQISQTTVRTADNIQKAPASPGL